MIRLGVGVVELRRFMSRWWSELGVGEMAGVVVVRWVGTKVVLKIGTGIGWWKSGCMFDKSAAAVVKPG